MKRESTGPVLSAVFVDYDNIYLSLKRKNEEAAKRFAKDAATWIKEVESGRLITPTAGHTIGGPRRIVMNRCYGNPVPRRNQNDNSTDMNSFPFVRHHFLRAGFEVVDCPPLTQQLKNSADIRMVMDVRDFLTHDTYFDEFVILSGDADFTPVLHRLRAHARRTVVFANDYTAAPYTAISDGEIRETSLLSLLLDGRIAGPGEQPAIGATGEIDTIRKDIITEVTNAIRAGGMPLPLEVLAERAMRALGHDKTVGTNWAGAGSFRELLLQALPDNIRLTEQPPYMAYEAHRPTVAEQQQPMIQPQPAHHPMQQAPRMQAPQPAPQQLYAEPGPQQYAAHQPARQAPISQPIAAPAPAAPPIAQRAEPIAQPPVAHQAQPAPAARQPIKAPPQHQPQPTPQQMRSAEGATALQQSISRIHDACQAPPLSPPEYRALFEIIAQEINEAGLQGAQTVTSITNKAQAMGLDVRRDDVRFVLEVVSEADPWFEQGASANLFAGRFRNFVVARCRSQGLNLTADELDLVDAWFAGNAGPVQQAAPQARIAAPPAQQPTQAQPAPRAASGDRWWTTAEGTQPQQRSAPPAVPARGEIPESGDIGQADDFPRIVKNRLRG